MSRVACFQHSLVRKNQHPNGHSGQRIILRVGHKSYIGIDDDWNVEYAPSIETEPHTRRHIPTTTLNRKKNKNCEYCLAATNK